MKMVNRNSFVVKPKQPYVDWINAQPDQDTPVSLAEIHRDCTTYLIPEMIGEEDAQEYIQAFKLEIFAIELDSWYRDPKTWPKKRTLAMFDDWFDLEFHSMIFDLEKKPIFKE
ncbi:MAG: hypothetical protein ISS57_01150 [Anaerolineales bacterium]|nr:hypothetical protein [Anaerolineales bacterium]